MTRKVRRKSVKPVMLAVVMGTMAIGFAVHSTIEDSVSSATIASVALQSPNAAGVRQHLSKTNFTQSFEYGSRALRQDDAKAALIALENARRLRPKIPKVHVNLGFVYLALAQPAAARSSFLKSIELNPNQSDAHYGLAESADKLGNFDEALGAMRTYLRLTDSRAPHRSRAESAVEEWQLRQDNMNGGKVAASVQTRSQEGLGSAHRPLDSLWTQELIDLDGTAAKLAGFAGRSILLNVWATWCGPCRAELPELQRLSERAEKDGLVVIGLAVDEDRHFVREYLAEVGVTFPNFIDRSGGMVRELLGVTVYPQTLVISANGHIRQRIAGARNWDDPAVLPYLTEVNATAIQIPKLAR